jgi:hypothetical protein
MTDPLLRMLADLPSAQPDPERSARLRARCLSRLERRRRSRRERPRGSGGYWQPLVAGLGGVYLTEVIRQALRFYAIL